MTTDIDKAAMAISLLCEGMSVRATARLTNLDKDTICRIIIQAGKQIEQMSYALIIDREVAHVSIDEIWGFTFCKQKTMHRKKYGDECGDTYSFVAMDTCTKMILCSSHGHRDYMICKDVVRKLQRATTGVFDISTDGYRPLKNAIAKVFGHALNYGVIIKVFGKNDREGQARYSPAPIMKTINRAVTGNPRESWITTSYSERLNLSLRMMCRRLTRLTNAFSKSRDHHYATLNVVFGVYNFCKKHSTVGTTPAVAQEITENPWTVRELIEKSAEFDH